MIVCASTSFKFRRNPPSTSRCRKSANIDSQFCRRARAGSRHEGTSFHRRRSTRKRTRGTRATVKSRKGNAGGPRGSPRPINPPLRISSQPSDQERNCSYQPASLAPGPLSFSPLPASIFLPPSNEITISFFSTEIRLRLLYRRHCAE